MKLGWDLLLRSKHTSIGGYWWFWSFCETLPLHMRTRGERRVAQWNLHAWQKCIRKCGTVNSVIRQHIGERVFSLHQCSNRSYGREETQRGWRTKVSRKARGTRRTLTTQFVIIILICKLIITRLQSWGIRGGLETGEWVLIGADNNWIWVLWQWRGIYDDCNQFLKGCFYRTLMSLTTSKGGTLINSPGQVWRKSIERTCTLYRPSSSPYWKREFKSATINILVWIGLLCEMLNEIDRISNIYLWRQKKAIAREHTRTDNLKHQHHSAEQVWPFVKTEDCPSSRRRNLYSCGSVFYT